MHKWVKYKRNNRTAFLNMNPDTETQRLLIAGGETWILNVQVET
jgi:hypothetical protein